MSLFFRRDIVDEDWGFLNPDPLSAEPVKLPVLTLACVALIRDVFVSELVFYSELTFLVVEFAEAENSRVRPALIFG